MDYMPANILVVMKQANKQKMEIHYVNLFLFSKIVLQPSIAFGVLLDIQISLSLFLTVPAAVGGASKGRFGTLRESIPML